MLSYCPEKARRSGNAGEKTKDVKRGTDMWGITFKNGRIAYNAVMLRVIIL
jgi:hypothetical protein